MVVSPAELPGEGRPTTTVLLVEDQEAVAIAARRILVRAGYKVISARDGSEALAMLKTAAERVDVLVTDMTMPKMGGAELVRRSASVAPHLAIVYMSGFAEEVIPPELVRHTFLQKPFSIEALTGAVRKALEARA